MKYNMKQWVKSLKGTGAKKPIPVLSFPCVSLLGITVRELISDSELQAKGMKLVAPYRERCKKCHSQSTKCLNHSGTSSEKS